MDKAEAINIVRQYRLLIKDHFNIEKVYLYGSFARDEQSEDSDIDVAVIVKELKGDFFSTSPLLWKLRRQIDERIEPVLLESGKDLSGFLEEIENYGIEIVD